MAYYRFGEVVRLAAEGKVRFATNDAVKDAAELDIDDIEKLSRVISLLSGSDWNNSVPACATLFGLLDADSYCFYCDLDELQRVPVRTGTKLYIKLAVHKVDGADHESCLIISIHPSKFDAR